MYILKWNVFMYKDQNVKPFLTVAIKWIIKKLNMNNNIFYNFFSLKESKWNTEKLTSIRKF